MARPISSRWPRPYQRCPTRKITIYGWSTSRPRLNRSGNLYVVEMNYDIQSDASAE